MSEFLDADALYDTVAQIFAVTVLLDKRERDAELVEFTHACMVQNHRIRPGQILSSREIGAWFDANRARIKDALSADPEHSYRVGLLERIHDPELQRSVLSSIFTISVCDYELHDEERGFIQTALSVWNAALPTPEEVEAVA